MLFGDLHSGKYEIVFDYVYGWIAENKVRWLKYEFLVLEIKYLSVWENKF